MELALGDGNTVSIRYCCKWFFILLIGDTKIFIQQEQRENFSMFEQNRLTKQTHHNYNLRIKPNLTTPTQLIIKQILPHRPIQIQIPSHDHYLNWIRISRHTNYILLYITQSQQCRV